MCMNCQGYAGLCKKLAHKQCYEAWEGGSSIKVSFKFRNTTEFTWKDKGCPETNFVISSNYFNGHCTHMFEKRVDESEVKEELLDQNPAGWPQSRGGKTTNFP